MASSPLHDDLPAAALRRAVRRLGTPQPGVPLAELVRLGWSLRGRVATLELRSTRAIGVPVIVLQPAVEPAPQPLPGLSRREREVAALIARGCRNAEIARRLAISVATVKDHVHRILAKTGMGSRTEVAAALARAGL